MTDYDNSNSAALFKNKDKEEGSKQPDYKGFGEVDGKKKDIAAWIRKSKKGETFMSLKFQAPRQQQAGDDDTAPRKQRDDDQDFPF